MGLPCFKFFRVSGVSKLDMKEFVYICTCIYLYAIYLFLDYPHQHDQDEVSHEEETNVY